VQTSIIACFPGADALVEPWRLEWDPWARRGVGAHVTLIRDFLPAQDLTPPAISALREAVPDPFGLRFDQVNQLPGAIALMPQQIEYLETLTRVLARSAGWDAPPPRRRPYHLTVACSDSSALAAEIRTRLEPLLPLSLCCPQLQVVEHDHQSVVVAAAITLRPRASGEQPEL
jgi:2'-5' RNA ligase superfamily